MKHRVMRSRAVLTTTMVAGVMAASSAAAGPPAKSLPVKSPSVKSPSPKSALTLVEKSVVDGVQSYTIHSAIMQRDYLVSVSVPEEPLEAGKRYPAFVVTDGNWALAPAQIAYGGAREAMPGPMFVVAIGVPASVTPQERTIRRIFEFSPPGWDRQDAFGKAVSEACEKAGVPPARCTGGAPAFSGFITRELLPALAAALPIDDARLTLGGISAGGFFGLWVAFQPDSPFRNYIISSPAMQYGDGEILRLEAAYAGMHRDFPIGIYMGSGSLEIDDPFLEGVGGIVSGQARLGGMLKSRKYPSLRLFSEIHHGLGHVDASATSYARGMRLLLAK